MSTKPAADDSKISKTITIGGKTFKVEGDVNLTFTEVPGPVVPDPEPPEPGEPTKPTEGTVLHGGWGANMDPKTWVRTVMKNPATEFKVTDGSKNVATNFKTAEAADNFIKYFQRFPDKVPEINGPVTPPPPPDNGGGTPGGGGGGNPIDPNALKDAQGVVMIYKPKQGGQVVTASETNQKESDHNTGSRSSLYSNNPYSANSGELTEYFEMDLDDSGEQNAPKLLSGGHTGSGDSDETRQGCCYAVGVNENGSLHLAKEWPHHPVTPKAYDKINYVDQSWKNLGGSIKNKLVGMKIIYYPADGGTKIEWWFDKKGLETGKLENDWKQMAWAHDKGDWGDKFGPALTENQGVKYKGKILGFYIRIDTPKKPVKFSHQGQHELEIPLKKLV